MEIHLDMLGGVAGDMFIAALLDAFPRHESCVLDAIRSLSLPRPVSCRLVAHTDTILCGHRFVVEPMARGVAPAPFAASHTTHAHNTWADVKVLLQASPLAPGVRTHALGIFRLLAEAEGFVHGIEPDAVAFHEVGAWDSIADIVGAAALIDVIAATRWTASAAPLGSGRVKTAHGVLPVPAPATARLLLGMNTVDDGIGGERVTPTGAAILRYLCPPDSARAGSVVRRLSAGGTGFGTRVLAGLSNHLRVLCFEPVQSDAGHRQIAVLNFEVDDQSGEDLATGLDRLRSHEGVLDVTQSVVFGKKGRMMAQVCVLARCAQLSAVIDACFRETTTIGVRHHIVDRVMLPRRFEDISIDGQRVRVKIVERPGGVTAKAESDDVRSHASHALRADLRTRAERAVLDAMHADVDA